jgi:hypothetical protein
MQKLTHEFTDEMIQQCAEFISRGWFRWVVRRAMIKQFPSLAGMGNSAFTTLWQAAQSALREEERIDIKTSRSKALEFYQAVVANEHVEMRDRLRAQQRIDELLGHADVDAGSEEQLDELKKFLAALEPVAREAASA